MKESILQKDVIMLNMYAPNNRFKLLKAKTDRSARKIDESTIIFGDINILLRNEAEMDRSSRQKNQ